MSPAIERRQEERGSIHLAQSAAATNLRRPAFLLTLTIVYGLVRLASPSPAAAQKRLGEEFVVNSTTYRSHYDPEIGRAAGGDFLVVWSFEPRGQDSLLGQGFDRDGNRLGSEFEVSSTGSIFQTSVSADPEGNFIVIFDNYLGIEGRKYDASGTLVGAEFSVIGARGLEASPPDVSTAADGSFVVVWEDSTASYRGIWSRRFDTTGTPLTGKIKLNDVQFSNQRYPAVASAPEGDFVIAWQSRFKEGPANSTYGILAQRIDESGHPLGGEFLVNTYTTGEQRYPGVAMSEDGDFVVVWSSLVSNLETRDIRGQRYDASGTPLGGELVVSTGQARSEFPVVASDADGDFVVAWTAGSFDQDVWAREFAADGSPRSGAFRVNSFTLSFQGQQAIASDRDGNYVVVWSSVFNISGQRFAGSDLRLSVAGSCPGPVSVSIANAPPTTEVAVVAAGNTNGFVKGGQVCSGTTLAIGEPFQMPPTLVLVDGQGNGGATLELAANRCFVQALALADCSASNTVEVPQ